MTIKALTSAISLCMLFLSMTISCMQVSILNDTDNAISLVTEENPFIDNISISTSEFLTEITPFLSESGYTGNELYQLYKEKVETRLGADAGESSGHRIRNQQRYIAAAPENAATVEEFIQKTAVNLYALDTEHFNILVTNATQLAPNQELGFLMFLDPLDPGLQRGQIIPLLQGNGWKISFIYDGTGRGQGKIMVSNRVNTKHFTADTKWKISELLNAIYQPQLER